LPDCSAVSAPPALFRLTRSHWLKAWWLGLHAVLAAAAVLASPSRYISLLLLAGLLLHWRRRPASIGLMLVCHGGQFALPEQGRFRLMLAEPAGIGPFWVRLVFTDRPGSQILLLRDQLPELQWRRLGLMLREGS